MITDYIDITWQTNWSFLIPITLLWVGFIAYSLRGLATIKLWEINSLLLLCSLPLHGFYDLAGTPVLPLYAILVLAWLGLLVFRKDKRPFGSISRDGHLKLLGIGRKAGDLIKAKSDLHMVKTLVLSSKEISDLEKNHTDLSGLILEAIREDIEILPISKFLQEEYGYIDTYNNSALSELGVPRRRILRGTKRIVDSVIAVLILLIAAPLMLIIAILILAFDGRPILFKQNRLGKGARLFAILKFRTMTEVESDNKRITKLGTVLRQTHLDELPQLLNILSGSMAIIGPRPEWVLLSTPELAPKDYWLRQAVRPGLTGWAQVNYKPSRTLTMRNRKLGYDLYYIYNRSVFLDILIWFRTFQRLPNFFISIFRKKTRHRIV